MKVSVIIVNYNVTALLRNCLKSVEKYLSEIDYEVIVADNDSTDKSWKILMDEFPKVKFMPLKNNFGFSVANNLAVKKSSGEYILLLNPDTEIESYVFQELLHFAGSKENFGCLGVRMHNAAGNFLPESKRSVPDIFNSFEKLFTGIRKNDLKSYYRNDIGEYEISEVEIITGAFFLCKKQVYLNVGGLDERYFMYGEDVDLCYTLLQNGYRNYYYGKMSILHHKGESTVKDLVYLDRFYGAMHIFIEKYYKTQKPLQYFFLKAGLKLRHKIEQIKLK